MRFHQSIHWVALPGGVESGEGGELRLSVFIAPQLGVLPDTPDAEEIGLPLSEWPEDARPTLADYPLFQNWAAEAARVEFSVEVQGRPAVRARRVSEPPSPETWVQVFGPETRVQPFAMDHPHIATASTFAVDAIVDSLEQGYSQATLYEPPDFDLDLPLEIVVEETHPVDPESGGDEPIIMSLFPDVVEMTTGEEFDFLVNGDQQVFLENLNARLAVVTQATAEETEHVGQAEAGPRVERVPPVLLPSDGTRTGEWARLMAFRRVGETFCAPPDLELDAETISPQEGQEVYEVPTLQEWQRAEERERLHRSLDLHKMLAALGDHPAVLRPLGLVIDLLVPADVLIGATNPRIRICPQWTSGSAVFDLADDLHEDLSPWTEFVHDPAAGTPFVAKPRTGGDPGFLPLGRGGYRVEPVDVDGAAAQVMLAVARATANAAARAEPALEGQSAGTTDPSAPVPALRTGGVTLIEAARAENLMNSGARAVSNADPSTETVLFAEDLVRGYRADVNHSDRWRSLHARVVKYLLDGQPVLETHDEGLFRAALTGPARAPGAAPSPGDVINVHESLLTWDGWSLSAPRPGASLSADPLDLDAVENRAAVRRTANDPLTSSGLQIETTVEPGTLPKLRFGGFYVLRLRTVDLAGNSLSLAEADARTGPVSDGVELGTAISSPAVSFLRFEPVPPPVVVREGSLPPGDTTHRIVVRSGIDKVDPRLGSMAGIARFLLFAPKGSVRLAELHGRFDEAIGWAADGQQRRSAAYEVAAEEIGTFEHHELGSRELPYLPDPQSAGVAMWNVPGLAAGETLLLPWDEPTWATPKAIEVAVVATDLVPPPPPVVDLASRTVAIYLPETARCVISVASMIRDVDLMALLDWSRKRLMPADFARVKREAERHRHYLFSPAQPIELVHAVPRPRIAPDSATDDYQQPPRLPGATNWLFGGGYRPHAPSTANLDLRPTWRDFVDEPRPSGREPDPPTLRGAPAPAHVDHDVAIGSIPVPWQPKTARADADKAVQASGVAEAPGTEVNPLVRFYELDAAADPSSTKPQAVPPLEFGDTRHRVVRFTARATTRFAEFFPPDWALDGKLTRPGATREVWLPNTARPPAPVVLDVAPLVARTTPEPGVFAREGGWVRLWLARPWFVSGHNERLGVVAAPTAPSGPGTVGYTWSSLLGGDPARESAHVPSLVPIPFTLGDAEDMDVVIQEPPDQTWEGTASHAKIRGYLPVYDSERDAWYCDVRVAAAGLYFPFVRLAVTRMQSFSIKNPYDEYDPDHYRFSPVVALEPIQLLPDRTLTVSGQRSGEVAAGSGGLRLQVTGPTYSQIGPVLGEPAGPEYLARVVARLQQRVLPAGIGDDLLAWRTITEFPFVTSIAAGVSDWSADLALEYLETIAPHPEPGPWRLLVIEQDHLHPASGWWAARPVPRTVYSEAVDLAGPVQVVSPT